MFCRVRLFIFMSCVLVVAPLAAQEPGKDSQLPRDPNNVYGKFENGLSYIIRPHANPPGRVAFYLHVRTGALNETRAQNGLAHFLEHMAFNGSKNFAPGELIPFMDRLGMQFGAHSNAHTSRSETVYKLFMTDNTEEMVDIALRILSDVADGLLLPEEEVNRERDVILEEARARKGAQQRMSEKLMERLLPGTRFAAHNVIGKEEGILSFPRSEFVDYYNTWYRPERMTLIVVGEVDAKMIVEKSGKALGDFKGRAPARVFAGTGITAIDEKRAIILSDPEQPAAVIQVMAIKSGRPPMRTHAEFRYNEIENIGPWIVSRRLQDLVQQGKASFRFASSSVSGILNDALLPTVMGTGSPHEWNKVLEQLVVEVQRAIQHGFTERELDLARKALLAGAEQSVQTETTWNARTHLNAISRAIGADAPLLSAEQRLRILESILAKVTVKDVHDVFVENFKTPHYTYVVMLPEQEGFELPAEEKVLDVANKAWQQSTDKIEDEKTDVAILEKLPEPGEVVSRVTEDTLKITDITLSNGVVVHHRYMDDKKEQAWIRVTLPGGELQETAANRGVSAVAGLANATSRLSSTQIRDAMTGKKVSVQGTVSLDATSFEISGTPAELEEGLKLFYALYTDGHIEESTFDNWKKLTLQSIEAAQTNPRAQLQEAISAAVYGGDVRLSPVTAAQIEKLSAKQGKAWLRKLIDGAPIEVAVVGDISIDATVKLARRYLASLPKATRDFSSLDALRKVERGSGPYTNTREFQTITPQAQVMAGFMGCDMKDTVDRRVLTMASTILSIRMNKHIREELQLVYGIFCQNQPSQVIPGFGMLFAGSSTDPANAQKLADVIIAMMKELAEKGPTADEVEVARKQIHKRLETAFLEPTFWLRQLSDMRYRGRTFEEMKQLPAIYDTFTPELVQQVLSKYVKDERTIRVIAVPKVDKN